MKVLIIGTYKKTGAGGISGNINNLATHLSNIQNISVQIITFGNVNNKEKMDNGCTLNVIKTRHFFFSIFKIIEDINPDVINIHGTFLPFSILAIFLSKKYPVVLTVHALVSNEYRYHKGPSYLLKRFIDQPIERHVIKKMKNIIIVSPILEKPVKNMTKSRIFFIPNALNIGDTMSAITINSIELKHPAILFVGSFGKIKGLDILIEAIPFLIKRYKNIKLYVAGSGARDDELKKYVESLKIEDNVKFLGYISGSNKHYYFKNSDIFVIPSLSDSFPTSLLEAMVMKVPVVASNVGGIPFIIEDGKSGLLFERGNPTDLSEKIIMLLENKKLCADMCTNGLERVKQYTWDGMENQIVDVYNDTIYIFKTKN